MSSLEYEIAGSLLVGLSLAGGYLWTCRYRIVRPSWGLVAGLVVLWPMVLGWCLGVWVVEKGAWGYRVEPSNPRPADEEAQAGTESERLK